MDTFEKIEVVKKLVAKYLKENGTHAGLSEADCQNDHIVQIGTSILCTRWNVGYAGGGFVQAVVDNDLQRAIANADSTNVRALKFYCQLMYNVGMPYFDEKPLDEMEQFIKDIANDYQFDKSHPEYCGFLNIDPSEHRMGLAFVYHHGWESTQKLLRKYGIWYEGKPNPEEVVFIKL
jgi:hypothetical protein